MRIFSNNLPATELFCFSKKGFLPFLYFFNCILPFKKEVILKPTLRHWKPLQALESCFRFDVFKCGGFCGFFGAVILVLGGLICLLASLIFFFRLILFISFIKLVLWDRLVSSFFPKPWSYHQIKYWGFHDQGHCQSCWKRGTQYLPCTHI